MSGAAVLTVGLLVPHLAGRLAAPSASAESGGAPSAEMTPTATPAPFVSEPTVRFEEAPPQPHRAAGVPVELVLPRLGVRAPVTPIAVADRVLVPPADPRTLGWWRDGARPGALLGGALVAGHTVSTGGGAFDDLDTLRRGDRVRVRTGKGVIRYVVTAVSVYRKATLARHAERLFDQSVPGRLVLVTCEDWDGERYRSNAVVLAEPVRG